MITAIKNHKIKFAVVLAVVLAVTAAFVLYYTEPYAVYADGTKVEEPYAVLADDKELFLVEDAETAEKVIETVLAEYSPAGAQINSITVDKQLSADGKELQRGEEPPTVLTEKEAIAYVLEENKTEKPLFSVTINAEIGSLDGIDVEKTYQETDELYEGETELKSKGTAGSQIVTNQVISVNGAVLTSEVVDTAVVNESTPTIVYKGTKERPRDTVYADYSGEVMGSGDGASIANFALQFCGNPYVYGGTSLTNGADCSGFVYAVYRSFGINLPRTGQQVCGKGVSLSEAQPGDIVVYPGHVAIYIGGGRVVHALNESVGICVSSVHTCGSILTIRRIVE